MPNTVDAINILDTGKLSAYLQTHIDGFKGPLSADKFAGGQSNPTFLINARSGKYVLRRKPPGELLKSAHAVDREFKVLTALADTDVPVARGYHLCENDAVIGSMFYIMSFEQGRIFWNSALPELSKQQRGPIYTEMTRVLAAMHSVDINVVGLAGLRLPDKGLVKGLCDIDRNEQGIPDEDTIIAQYCNLRGIEHIDHWHFYLAFSFFRLAAICQGVYKRALGGNASSEQALESAKIVEPLAQMAVALIFQISSKTHTGE